MKKQLSILSLGLALMGSHAGFSQETKIQPCNTYAAMEQHFAEDPSAKAAYDAHQDKLYKDYLQYSNDKAANRTAAVVYTVPVVFHILHQGGPENISDATIINAMAQINKDYAREGSDTAGIFTPFKNSYIPSDIKFMLAKKDPAGNCITGIVRHIDPKTNWSQTLANPGTAAGNAYYAYTWDPTKYLNVYIVANIVPQGTVTGGGVIVGYTYRPGTWPTGNPHDAIVYRYNFLNNLDARSLSHEMGHWLNLAHTFGNTNNPGVACGSLSGGDGIADTPDTKGNFGTCPAASTNTNYTCTSPDPSVANGSLYFQNVQNFMDYSGCPKNFTTGQTNMMRSTLQGATNGRNNVCSAANLSVSATDVNGLGLCGPIADFLSTTNNYTVCLGGSLTMKDQSYNGTITAWQWTAGSGAVIASNTASITNITFNTVGVVNVSLTVTNAQGTSTPQARSVTVLSPGASVAGPYMESFESAGLPLGWSITNTPAVVTTWQQTNNAALDAAYSMYIDGPSTQAGQIATLQMPAIDLLNNPGANFSFGYAYARQSSTQNDVFKMQMSSDCGGTWMDVYSPNAAQMALNSGGTTSVPYVPTSSSEWNIASTFNPVTFNNDFPNWFNFTGSSNVLIRFVFQEGTPGAGNNFYLDAVNFSSVITGVNELTKSIRLGMYPNPTTGETNLHFTLSDAADVNVSVVDVLGKQVLPAASYKLSVGEQNIVVNKDNTLARGVYFVNMSVNGTKMSRKLIVE